MLSKVPTTLVGRGSLNIGVNKWDASLHPTDKNAKEQRITHYVTWNKGMHAPLRESSSLQVRPCHKYLCLRRLSSVLSPSPPYFGSVNIGIVNATPTISMIWLHNMLWFQKEVSQLGCMLDSKWDIEQYLSLQCMSPFRQPFESPKLTTIPIIQSLLGVYLLFISSQIDQALSTKLFRQCHDGYSLTIQPPCGSTSEIKTSSNKGALHVTWKESAE